jgi:hypothetical protein
MPETEQAPVQIEQPQTPPREPTLADKLIERVEKMRSAPAEPSQVAPEATKVETPPADTPAEKPTQKPRKRRQEAIPPEDAILPPEPVEDVTTPDDADKQIEENLAKPDKADGIKHLRDAYQTSKQKIADLENQLKQAQATPKAPEDYDTLKKQVSEYSTELERLALERHPEFRKQFGQQMDMLDGAAKKLVGNLNGTITEQEFTALLSAPASDGKTNRINELIEGASPLVASKIANLVSNYEQLNDQRSAMLAKHSETLKQLDMNQRAEMQQRLEREQLGFEQVVNDASSQFEYLKPVEGNDAWNNLVNTIKGKAKALYFQEKDPATLMRATVLAAMAEPYRNAFLLMKAQNQKLQAQIDEIEKAAPGFDGGKGGVDDKKPGDWDEKKGFVENFAERIATRSGGLGGRA